VRRGEIWWASLPDPIGSGPGFRRPVLIIQADEFNASKIKTVIIAIITSNTKLAEAPGNVRLSARASTLRRDSVVNVSQLLTIDRSLLMQRVARLPAALVDNVDEGLRRALGL
jgi:mRNA interferase MazF